MDLLHAPEYQPFVVAGLVMVGLVAIEAMSLVAGFSLSAFIDKGLHLAPDDTPGAVGGLLGWVNAGRVPMLVLLIVWLCAFAAAGFVVQTVALSIWEALPTPAAGFTAFLVANPATRVATRAISRLVPRDETYIVSHDELIGRVGEVTLGPLDGGPAGRLKVRDPHGNLHFPMARAVDGGAPIPVGAQVLLVDRRGDTFLVVPAPADLTSDR